MKRCRQCNRHVTGPHHCVVLKRQVHYDDPMFMVALGVALMDTDNTNNNSDNNTSNFEAGGGDFGGGGSSSDY